VKIGYSFSLKLVGFVDATKHFTAQNAQIGDVIFIRGFNNKAYRLEITAIHAKNAVNIECDVRDESNTLNTSFPLQVAAIVRETPHRQYPMFPVGIPPVLEKLMLDWYAILADRPDTEGGACTGNLKLAGDIVGTETICMENADGSKSKITLTELRKWMHTWKTLTGADYYFDTVTEAGQMVGSTPPQY
jgi:hypothetical protein